MSGIYSLILAPADPGAPPTAANLLVAMEEAWAAADRASPPDMIMVAGSSVRWRRFRVRRRGKVMCFRAIAGWNPLDPTGAMMLSAAAARAL